MNAALEKRAYAAEVRADNRRLTGYAAIFDTEARIGGRFTETIAKGAFSASLNEGDDILALVDHDQSKVLARTRSGSLKLFEDSKGLAFDILLPDTQAGRDVLALAERQDLGGMSFGFTAVDDKMIGDRRELRSVQLHEISVVLAWPAYEGTSIHARSRNIPTGFAAYSQRVVQLMEVAQ